MKKRFFVLISISFFISCNNKEKYQGKWVYNYYNSIDKDAHSPSYLLIENDSIKFNHWAFDYWQKYPLTIDKNKLLFNNWNMSSNIVEDTLTINKIDHFIKDNNDSIFISLSTYPILEINLPKIKGKNLFNQNDKHKELEYHILFGKRLDNNEYGLQLNDQYAKIRDLPSFISVERSSIRCELSPIPLAILYIEKTSPMKYVEDIFYNLSIVNQLKVSFVNNINLTFNDSFGIYYEYEHL